MSWNILSNNDYVKKVLELAELGTFHANLHGDNLFVNEEWEKIFGISGERALGKAWMGLVVDEDMLLINSLIQSAIFEYEAVMAFSLRIRHPEKGLRYLTANFKRIYYEDNDYFIGYVQDITDIKLVEQQLKTANEQLAQSNHDKDRMMKVLAHDLKNPIEGICSLTSIMLEDQSHPQETSEMLQLVHDSCSYSAEMIRDLIEATLNNHAETIKRREVDLQLLAQQCVRLLQYKTEEKDQQLLLASNKKILTLADPEKISRVMYNLISNAIKFSPTGADIIVRVEEKENAIRLSVLDKGIGIPNELKDKVFNMFSEAKRFGTANELPFGLGLSICKHIVEAHKGKIWFDSEPGCGTNFYVDLPNQS